jgi:hypothetical protein
MKEGAISWIPYLTEEIRIAMLNLAMYLCIHFFFVGLEILTTVFIKSTVFWDVIP